MIQQPIFRYDPTIDLELRRNIQNRLTELLSNKTYFPTTLPLLVAVRRRTVTLRGNLDNYIQRQQILDLVRSVPEVLRIYDEFKIKRHL